MEMKSTDQLISRIDNVFTNLDIHLSNEYRSILWDELPFIAVVGDKNCGKSSLLDSLLGKDFLPHGSEIVTRCPIVVQLHRLEKGTEYAEFADNLGTHLIDPADVRKGIASRTDKLMMGHISHDPIFLSFYSPAVINLTLVDLPGLTKETACDQPESIEQDIKKIVEDYIKKTHCIILVVSPANQDLMTSDALKLSLEADPKGERTIGVLTKIDTMDNENDVNNILEGNTNRSKFPWVGVNSHLANENGFQLLLKLLYQHLGQAIKSRTPYLRDLINTIITQLGNILLVEPPNDAQISQMRCVLEELRLLASPQLETVTFSHLGMGVLTPIINQLKSPIAATESLIAKSCGILIPLSAQHILDCYKPKFERRMRFYQKYKYDLLKEDDTGCFMHNIVEGFRFIRQFGVHRTIDYGAFAYRREECKCIADSILIGIDDFESITTCHEDVEQILLEQPVAAGMLVYDDIYFIGEEVYLGEKYRTITIDGEEVILGHAILIVAYGVEKGKPYYLVKGTYGKDWGIRGFAKISRDIVYAFVRPLGPYWLV